MNTIRESSREIELSLAVRLPSLKVNWKLTDNYRGQLLDKCMSHTGKSIRIGITGVPGVGKSTFIDSFGTYLLDQEYKVAVLAIDPSSAYSRGSILGDKTRMHQLSQRQEAFVRPSPSSGSLGGVARKTRETLLLCEAAGFDMILVETVGVGQSELQVKGMTDLFLLLMLANAGDELQGIKRGIMEMADLLFVNKADGDFEQIAKRAKAKYSQALRMLGHTHDDWEVPVITGSGLYQKGLDTCLSHIMSFVQKRKDKGSWQSNRQGQSLNWLKDRVEQLLLNSFWKHPLVEERLENIQEGIEKLSLSLESTAEKLIEDWMHDQQQKKGE